MSRVMRKLMTMITDNRGYSKKIILANLEASEESIGVQLGRWCISQDIPVSEIARYLDVTRMSIYGWFDGTYTPLPKHAKKIAGVLRNRDRNGRQKGG
jgi:DNA-binding XRE family transcriptional regulator